MTTAESTELQNIVLNPSFEEDFVDGGGWVLGFADADKDRWSFDTEPWWARATILNAGFGSCLTRSLRSGPSCDPTRKPASLARPVESDPSPSSVALLRA